MSQFQVFTEMSEKWFSRMSSACVIATISTCFPRHFHHPLLLLCSALAPSSNLHAVLLYESWWELIFLSLSVFQLQPEQLDCGAAHLQHPLALRRPLRAIPLHDGKSFSSVSVDNVQNHTVVFLGTSNGKLRKVRLTHTHTWVRTHSVLSKQAQPQPLNGVIIFNVTEPRSLEKF